MAIQKATKKTRNTISLHFRLYFMIPFPAPTSPFPSLDGYFPITGPLISMLAGFLDIATKLANIGEQIPDTVDN